MTDVSIEKGHAGPCCGDAFLNVVLTGASIVDIHIKVAEQLGNFNVISSHGHQSAQEKGGVRNLDLVN